MLAAGALSESQLLERIEPAIAYKSRQREKKSGVTVMMEWIVPKGPKSVDA